MFGVGLENAISLLLGEPSLALIVKFAWTHVSAVVAFIVAAGAAAIIGHIACESFFKRFRHSRVALEGRVASLEVENARLANSAADASAAAARYKDAAEVHLRRACAAEALNRDMMSIQQKTTASFQPYSLGERAQFDLN